MIEHIISDVRHIDKATPGPWQAWVEGPDGWSGDDGILAGPRTSDDETPDIYVTYSGLDGPQPASAEDMDFIAHARQDIPTLLDEIRRLRAERG
jgi:hypothetical protein